MLPSVFGLLSNIILAFIAISISVKNLTHLMHKINKYRQESSLVGYSNIELSDTVTFSMYSSVNWHILPCGTE